MYVCLCKGVTDRAIRRAVCGGCVTFSELQRCTGVGTQCGKCSSDARRVMNQAQAKRKGESPLMTQFLPRVGVVAKP